MRPAGIQTIATVLTRDHVAYPARLRERLGNDAPAQLHALGCLDFLRLPKAGVFCSARSPGSVVLTTYDQAAKWRAAGRCVISGFHSPVEKECLRILLRGSQPIIICLARALPKRLPANWGQPLADGRLLILSAFDGDETRVTAELAFRRNQVVAALADEVYVAHMEIGGKTAEIVKKLTEWKVPLLAPGGN